MYLYSLHLFIIAALIGCGIVGCKPKEEKVEITYVRHDTTVIEEHSYLKGDTIKHGMWRYYYRNKSKRILQEEISYKYGKKDGWNIHCREDGTLESKIFFKNDLVDSVGYWYYSNGDVESEIQYYNGKQYGSAKSYSSKNKLDTFNIFDYKTEIMYAIIYDSLGNKLLEEGLVISPDYLILYGDDVNENPIYDKTIKSGKPFLMKLTVAQTPETKTVVTMQDLTENQLVPTAVFENYTVTYKQTLTKPGIHSYKVKGEMYGLEHNNLLRQDSVVVNIEVVNK